MRGCHSLAFSVSCGVTRRKPDASTLSPRLRRRQASRRGSAPQAPHRLRLRRGSAPQASRPLPPHLHRLEGRPPAYSTVIGVRSSSSPFCIVQKSCSVPNTDDGLEDSEATNPNTVPEGCETQRAASRETRARPHDNCLGNAEATAGWSGRKMKTPLTMTTTLQVATEAKLQRGHSENPRGEDH